MTVTSTMFSSIAVQTAFAETRSLKLYSIHTKERAEIVYKRNGRYVQSGLNQINRFLRDWRRNEATRMDPRLLDLVWSVYRSVGARDYIHVVSAYRSPWTNNALRHRSSGVAKKSQHTLGKAMDFYIPGVPLSTLRAAAFKAERGGVGYYPKSGAPFVHLDVGNVRSWPRMSRRELLALFPDGKTMHLPADGIPLPGHEQAVATYNARGRGGEAIVIGSIAGASGNSRRGLFGSGADEEEDAGEAISATFAKRTATAASARTEEPAALASEVIVAALPEEDRIPRPEAAPRLRVDVGPSQEASSALVAELPVIPLDAPSETATLNVPLPTPRPDDHLPSANVPLPSPSGIHMASAGVGHLNSLTVKAGHDRDGVETSRRAHKPTSADLLPGPRSRLSPVPQAVVQWALSNEAAVANAAGIRAPSFVARRIVRTPPRMVYTAGFVPADREFDANRFSGDAVKFLPVARFASK